MSAKAKSAKEQVQKSLSLIKKKGETTESSKPKVSGTLKKPTINDSTKYSLPKKTDVVRKATSTVKAKIPTKKIQSKKSKTVTRRNIRSDVPTCQFILLRGAREGEACGRPISTNDEEQEFCNTHFKKMHPELIEEKSDPFLLLEASRLKISTSKEKRTKSCPCGVESARSAQKSLKSPKKKDDEDEDEIEEEDE